MFLKILLGMYVTNVLPFPTFSHCRNLQDNDIETVILDGTRLDRENYPSLTM